MYRQRRVSKQETIGSLYKGAKVKRALSLIGAASLFLSAIRILVLFSESYSLVSAERASDSELLRICKEQESTAISSSKLRGACLQARTDSAAPLVFKALLKAVSTLFSDFSELFSSPTRILVQVMFVISGLGAPIVGLLLKTFLAGLRVTSGSKDHDSDDSDSEAELRQLTLVVGPEWGGDHSKQNLRRRLRQDGAHALSRAVLPGVSRLEDLRDEGAQNWMGL